jgi:hypothetical protein
VVLFDTPSESLGNYTWGGRTFSSVGEFVRWWKRQAGRGMPMLSPQRDLLVHRGLLYRALQIDVSSRT